MTRLHNIKSKYGPKNMFWAVERDERCAQRDGERIDRSPRLITLRIICTYPGATCAGERCARTA